MKRPLSVPISPSSAQRGPSAVIGRPPLMTSASGGGPLEHIHHVGDPADE